MLSYYRTCTKNPILSLVCLKLLVVTMEERKDDAEMKAIVSKQNGRLCRMGKDLPVDR